MILNMTGKGGGGTVLISDTLDANGGTIRTITAKKVVALQTKTITPTSSVQTVNPDTGYDGFSQVTVNAGGSSSDFIITVTYNTTTQNWEPDCTWAELSAANTAGKTIIVNATDSNDSYEPTADTTGFFDNDNYFEYEVNWFDFNQSLGLDGWVIHDIYEFSSSELTLSQRDSFTGPPYLITKNITTNGTYNAASDYAQGYSSVTVNVPTGSTINNQNKTVTPTESQQSITADSGYTGLGTVTVGAISTTYVGSGITRRDSDDLTASGATISVPAGYYAAAASKSVTSGSATGPLSLSGSSATITTGTNTITLTKTGITTTPTVSAGYVSSATASTATVALTASVTVNPTPTASGATVTIPAGYYSSQTTKSVTSGSATAPSTISGTAASVSTGTNTLTLTKIVSVTPTVSAGYVSSGTAGNASVSLTASVTTKAAATYHPSTTAQTIAASQYLTGAQTIAAVTTSNLSASNIVSGVTIKVGDSSDDDCVASVTGSVVLQNYYTGSSTPSSSLGSNGDLYLQS